MIKNISKKRLWAFLALVLIASAAIGYFFLQKKDDRELEHVIGSEDGLVTISVSDASLPDGISANDIAVKKLKPEEYTEDMKAIKPLFIYRFGPDGTKFTKPVNFSIIVDADDLKRLPMLLHVSASTTTLVQNVKITKREDGELAMSGIIDHFSDVVGIDGFVSAEMPANLGRHPVGESFVVPVTVQVTERVDSRSGDAYWLMTSPPVWGSKGGLFLGEKFLDPVEAPNSPPAGSKMTWASKRIEQRFTCIKAGSGRVAFVGALTYDYELYLTGIWRPLNIYSYVELDEFGGYIISLGALVECFDPPAKPVSNEPTSTPSKPKVQDAVKKPEPKKEVEVILPEPDPDPVPDPVLTPKKPQSIDTGLSVPPPVNSVPPSVNNDICCLDPEGSIYERYYIPFDGNGCLPGHKIVPLDKNCANPLPPD